MPSPFRVLLVCTGNICRSPIAERLFRFRLAEALPGAEGAFDVRSAGTLDLAGAEMAPYAAATLAGLGVDPAGHAARALVAEEVAAADLVLGMAREHRGAAIQLFPRASARTFTLFEFARYCGHVEAALLPVGAPGARASAIVAAAARRRGLDRPAHPSDDDLVDPLGARVEVFAATAAAIDSALRPFIDLLVGSGELAGECRG
ncbi:MAG: arsenate-mycothiol transferase ArsC [Mycobacteriales bacterium]